MTPEEQQRKLKRLKRRLASALEQLQAVDSAIAQVDSAIANCRHQQQILRLQIEQIAESN